MNKALRYILAICGTLLGVALGGIAWGGLVNLGPFLNTLMFCF